jgi:hypothetical protein
MNQGFDHERECEFPRLVVFEMTSQRLTTVVATVIAGVARIFRPFNIRRCHGSRHHSSALRGCCWRTAVPV